MQQAMELAKKAIRSRMNGKKDVERKIKDQIYNLYTFNDFEKLVFLTNRQNIVYIQYLYVIYAELGVKLFNAQKYKEAVSKLHMIYASDEYFLELLKIYTIETKEKYYSALKETMKIMVP